MVVGACELMDNSQIHRRKGKVYLHPCGSTYNSLFSSLIGGKGGAGRGAVQGFPGEVEKILLGILIQSRLAVSFLVGNSPVEEFLVAKFLLPCTKSLLPPKQETPLARG